jgi:hypothetical protein
VTVVDYNKHSTGIKSVQVDKRVGSTTPPFNQLELDSYSAIRNQPFTCYNTTQPTMPLQKAVRSGYVQVASLQGHRERTVCLAATEDGRLACGGNGTNILY